MLSLNRFYKGYKITKEPNGYTWKDNRGFTHYFENVTKTPFATLWEAEQSIDEVCFNMRPDKP
jgi:hypothetical protein